MPRPAVIKILLYVLSMTNPSAGNSTMIQSGRSSRRTGVYVDKPVLRGQFHKWGAILYPPLFGLPLYLRAAERARAWDDSGSISNSDIKHPNNVVLATFLFSFAIESIMIASGTLHTYPWQTHYWYLVARKLDFTAIFVGIACFYSSLGKLLLDHLNPSLFARIETLVWMCAAIGTMLKWFVPDAPKWFNAAIFLLQGWACAPFVPLLTSVGSANAAVTSQEAIGLVSGGIFITLGALAYALQWPKQSKHIRDIRHVVFGPHEMFHAGTLLMFLSFWYTMWVHVSSLSPNQVVH